MNVATRNAGRREANQLRLKHSLRLVLYDYSFAAKRLVSNRLTANVRYQGRRTRTIHYDKVQLQLKISVRLHDRPTYAKIRKLSGRIVLMTHIEAQTSLGQEQRHRQLSTIRSCGFMR